MPLFARAEEGESDVKGYGGPAQLAVEAQTWFCNREGNRG
jgi:hypothetical protein